MYIDVYEKIEADKRDETEDKIRDVFFSDKSDDSKKRSDALANGISAYIEIQKAANPEESDESSKFSKEFIDTYTKFYKMTKRSYDDEFIEKYFEIMSELRKDLRNKCALSQDERMLKDTFIKVLCQLRNFGSKSIDGERNHRYEMSFTSKMLHTFDPTLPIWDSVVATKHFGFIAPDTEEGYKENDIFILYYNRYKKYKETFECYMNDHDRGQILIDVFNEKYKDYPIKDAKKIDFILWQDRDKRK